MFRLLYLLYFCVLGHFAGKSQCVFTPIDTSGFECTTARYLCGSQLDGYSGSLTNFDTPGDQPGNFCGVSSPENIQWFSFLVSETNVEINISFSNCMGGALFDQGFQSGVYSGCDFVFDDLTCVSQTVASGTNNMVFSTTPGIHYLFVDGFAGSICDFTIEVVAGVCTDPFAVTNSPDATCRPLDVNDPDATSVQICQGETQFLRPDLDFPPIYNHCGILDTEFADMVNGEPFFCVETILSDPVAGTFISGEYIDISYSNPQSALVSQPIALRWDSVGIFEVTQTIYANPYLPSCLDRDTICSETLTITVLPYDTTYLPVDTICQGQSFGYCNMTWSTSQTIICTDKTDCSVKVLPLYVQPRQTVELDSVYICGSCFEIYGNSYCNAGSFADTGSVFCDTIVNFTVVPVTIDLSVLGDTVITCSDPMVVLQGEMITNYIGTIDFRWLDEAGTVVSNDEILNTSVSGTYNFEALIPDLDPCVFTRTAIVVEDVDLPSLQIDPPVLSCLTLSGNIGLSTNSNITAYNWTGPDGFSSDMAMPTVSDTGIYELSLVAANGCVMDTTVHVRGLFEEPSIVLNFQDLDCNITTGTASFTSNMPVSQEWLLPDNTMLATSNISYDQAGNYLLIVTSTNGCSGDSLFTVEDLVNDPTLSVLSDTVWRCNTTEIGIDISKDMNLHSSWSTANGTIGTVGDSIKLTSVGTYVGAITDLTTGCIGVDSVTIIDDPNVMAIDFQVVDPLCFGDSSGQVIAVFLAGQAPYSLTVNGLDADLVALDQLGAGSFDLHFTDLYECEVDTVFTLVDPEEVTITAASPINYKVGSELTLFVSHSVPDEELDKVGWYDRWGNELGTGLELHVGTDVDTSYTVQVWNIDGCTDRKFIEITFDYTKSVYAPTVFSPDGDGHQDYWFLKSVGTPDILDQVQVFSRWGELVYERSDIRYNDEEQGWNGRHQGQICPPGVYVYKAVFSDIYGVQHEQVGSITIFR